MIRRKSMIFVHLLLIALAVSWGINQGWAQSKKKATRDQVYVEKFKKIAPSAAEGGGEGSRQRGLKPGTPAAAATPLPGYRGRADAALFRSLRQLGVQPAAEGTQSATPRPSWTPGTGY